MLYGGCYTRPIDKGTDRNYARQNETRASHIESKLPPPSGNERASRERNPDEALANERKDRVNAPIDRKSTTDLLSRGFQREDLRATVLMNVRCLSQDVFCNQLKVILIPFFIHYAQFQTVK